MVLWQLILLFIAVATATDLSVQEDEPAEYQGDKYIVDANVKYTNFANVKTKKGGRKGVYVGGCIGIPDPPINGKIKCSADSGCIASCNYDHKFPNGVDLLAVTCNNAKWYVSGTDWTTIPDCEPICMPDCQNSGICIAPHQCNCPENFSGPQCQFENKPCLDSAPSILNSHRRCNSKFCTITCLDNFVYPDGSSVANLVCKNGNWVPTRTDWVSIPDCTPVCNPPCQNGGNCLPRNVCQCPQEFRGPQCQYSKDICSIEKLNFNGGISCVGSENINSCTLNCPLGIDFEFPPADAYICNFDTGIFLPQPIPQCKVDNNINIYTVGSSYNSYVHQSNRTWSIENMFESSERSNISEFFKLHTGNQMVENLFGTMNNNFVLVEEKRPEPKTCFTWGGAHYKTFDDQIFSFESNCSHIMLQEMNNAILTITVQNSQNCKTVAHCFRIIKLFINGKEYTLSLNERYIPEFRSIKKSYPIPVQLPGLRVEMSAHFIIVYLDSLGVKLKWDGALLLQIDASETMWNRTVGLCGRMNGDANDDLIGKTGNHPTSIKALANSWQLENIGETCNEYPKVQPSCTSHSQRAQEAHEFCTELLSDNKFRSCSSTLKISDLELACFWDYCACNDLDKRACACDTMNVYVRQCAHKGIVSLAGWRNKDLCPMQCTKGRVYMPCGPKAQPSCGSDIDFNINDADCEEGCFCPKGSLMHEDKCVPQEECPCRLRGKLFHPGASVAKDCNTCTCTSGKWICTQVQCSARCAIIGDPHYTTFDGKHYDFMGKCKYYLLKGEDYSIESENVACSGAISESLGFTPSETPSCTKTVTIRTDKTTIKLKQNKQLVINGEDINKLPLSVDGIKIQAASSIFLVVRMLNGLEVWWDGISRVYINAPAEFHSKTRGLCGTFSNNQKDDFITPDGDTEQVVTLFANKWKTQEQCLDVHEREPKHPCDLNPQKRAFAEEYCSKLHTDIFADCHWYVEPEVFYKDCLYDMCACTMDIKTCFCPILSAYAKDCAAAGIKLLWRHEIQECSIQCSGGQVYQICGNSCKRSCGDISFNPDCREECVEGCNCPEGQTLDIMGECIPIGQCPCIHSGIEFKAGYKEVRPGQKGQDLCTCIGGKWDCRLATSEELKEHQSANYTSVHCSAAKNLELTDCEPVKPKTCHNMHLPVTESPIACKPGCICKSGYVLDVINGICIKEDECPCHHGGKSYKDGSKIQSDCNTCQCASGKWNCTDRICAGVCSAWGDSHYETFDGKLFNFQGVCDYILAKGILNKEETFYISTQNVPCGTTGVSCSKSITLKVGHGTNQEVITLTKGKALPKGNFERIAIRTVGLFVFLDVPDLGLVLQWDKGTRIYIRLNPKWKGHTKGLCGDYNDNSEDDFKTPSGGISEVSSNLFGDSWKINDFCPEPKDIKDPCEQHPERKLWAIEKCNILKSDLFRPCHSEVDIEFYVKNCIFDTCSCDTGGDCECLCTSLAAYAQQCNAKGVPIKWRSQDLCPIQCDKECSSYSPCISTCPHETCDNLLTIKDNLHLCSQDACIEGCLFKPCANDYVYKDANYTECIPKATCKPICAEINGTVFLEGDEVSSDDCKTCFCSRGKVICQGGSCITVPTFPTIPLEEPQKCVDGWSAWINKDQNVKGQKLNDIEPLPSWADLASIEGSAICTKEQMIDIQCRSVKNHITSKESGLDVECSLESGLYCKSQPDFPCIDFEISVLCQCSPETTATSTTVPTSTEALNGVCELENSYKKHPTDCHIFYQCVHNVWVEKTCGSDMLYNQNFQICDWPANVMLIRPECYTKQTTPSKDIEWTKNTTTSYENTLITTYKKKVTTTKLCEVDEKWNDCAIKCSQTCEYYRFSLSEQGFCKGDTDCIPGCVSLKRTECPSFKFWKDFERCVDSIDCNCKSHNGENIKPGNVIKESECEICQCIHNYYTCDKTVCTNVTHQVKPSSSTPAPTFSYETEPTTSVTTEKNIMIVTSTVTPPEQCDSGRYIPLIQQSTTNEVSLNASSSSGVKFQPENAVFESQITNELIRSWQPQFVDKNQWLTVEFQHPLPIYGIILKGSPIDDKFVTSYQILFSEDGHIFSYVMDNTKRPRIFRGPVDGIKAVEQKFYEPVEAKIIRINPLTWHNGIAIKIELLGCEENVIKTTTASEVSTVTEFLGTTTVGYTEKVINPVCEDSMGLDDGLMSDVQVFASSSFDNLLPNLRLSAPGVWRPKLDNLNQYIQFDFLEPRNITGIKTKGDDNIWTSVYKVSYSIDGHQWNSIINDDNTELEFLGNFDSTNIKTNFFEKPLQTRFLRIQPIKWHEHIGLKVEVLGCFLPYPIVTTELPTSTELIIPECNICDGILKENIIKCNCDQSLWWNGVACVSKQNCPCVVGLISYAVGSIYESENCQQCSCTLGGVSSCVPKKCEPCNESGMQVVITELCSCICKPCPYGTRYCPTSNICLNETLWCNGVQDCPDDEKDCPRIETPTTRFESTDVVNHTTTPIPTKTTVPVPPVQCENPICPPGYKTVIRNGRAKLHTIKAYNNVYEDNYIDNKEMYTKGRRRPTKHSTKNKYRKSWMRHETVKNEIYNIQESMVCPHFTCVPIKPPLIFGEIPEPENCPDVACPPNYTIKYEKMSMYKIEKCRKYTCEPPIPLEVICNVTGRTFNTFDNLEYKYDICNHILARDMYGNKWYITLEKLCDKYNIQCSRNLAIFIDDEVIVLYPDMHMDINDYTYTSNQVGRLGDKFKLFKVSRVGDTVYLICEHYGFWIMWNADTNIKIGINKKLHGLVDGLCGYFDGNLLNDKQMPNGRQSKSTIEFGNSWVMEGASQCESQACPHDIQAQGWKLCNTVKDRSLAVCSGVVDLDKFLSRCLETACTCLRSKSTYDNCRCRTLTTFVTECQANDRNIDLLNWRNIYDCPGNCSAPFVHRDCFRNKCERSCNDLQEVDPCPIMEGVCFSGCFCPEGTVRNGDNCVPTNECRDCICEGFGNSKFISFDRKNFTFEGNCTYILSRDIIEETSSRHKNHTYQVLVSNTICDTGICTEAIIVLYGSHFVEIIRTPVTRMFEINVDNTIVEVVPYETQWLKFEETPGKDIKLLIPAIQLEIIVMESNFAFTVRVPSRIFGDAIEGLCGNCNNDIEDDLKQQDGKITDNVEEFGKSWLVNNSLPFDYNLNIQNCISKQEHICDSQKVEDDSCNQILSTIFAPCHDLVDPDPYLSICQDSLCIGGDYCDNLAAYSRKCAEAGLCINWRTNDVCPYTCPSHLQYQPCGSGCIETCDNINTKSNEICNAQFGEGCFCPNNYVFHNNTCIERKKCSACDDDGHTEGDIWYTDKCTTCSCHKNRVNCEKIECPTLETICEENMTPKLISGTETDCCSKYFCVAVTGSPLCEEMQQPECGFGQVMKLHTDTKGCQKFVCECLPSEECPILGEIELEVEVLEPGMVAAMNTSGCCPKFNQICNPSMCPSAPVCPDYYILNENQLKNACCSHYECNPPKDICIYNTTSNLGSQYVISKTIGEEWKENNCRTCVCENSDSGPEVKCSTIMCPDVKTHPDIYDFVMEEVLLNDECCPSLERVACKEGDQIYDVGKTWKPDLKDACITKECIKDANGIQKQIKVQNCNVSCDYGYEYRSSNDKGNDCCGECVAIGCVVNGEIKNIGEQWYSNDSCLAYSCQFVNGSLYINSVTEKCPEINPIDEQEFVVEKYSVPDKCCPAIVKTACRHNGKIYMPGEKWQDSNDNCITEICVLGANGVIKQQEIKTCSQDCPAGWSYQPSKDGKCCGDCQQMYCVDENILYEPGASWSLNDNCTTYTCLQKDDQFMVSKSSVDCPDVTNCPKESLYDDGCCKRCNLPILSQTGNCILNQMDLSDTIGMFIEENKIFGICKNLGPVEGITNCVGTCQSGTHFDKETWMQSNYCECCQPKEYRNFVVELTCENGAKISKQVILPVSCSCDKCASIK